jgi:hypothetical protein
MGHFEYQSSLARRAKPAKSIRVSHGPRRGELLAEAWQAANDKARELGWIV